jgi:hypothetical protein
MNLQAKLDQFRTDNPYDVETQAKRLLVSEDKELVLYTLQLGLATARQRQRHQERDYIKNVGEAPPKERLVPGRTTGSVKVIPTKKTRNAMNQFILDVWRVNGKQKLGDANTNDLATAISREKSSSAGHDKNAKLYTKLKTEMSANQIVREAWDESGVRGVIEEVYGEFRKQEAA